jgi:hypothetical protein
MLEVIRRGHPEEISSLTATAESGRRGYHTVSSHTLNSLIVMIVVHRQGFVNGNN